MSEELSDAELIAVTGGDLLNGGLYVPLIKGNLSPGIYSASSVTDGIALNVVQVREASQVSEIAIRVDDDGTINFQ